MKTLRACNQISYPSHNTKALSYKIFEHLALQVGSSNSLHKTQIHSIQSGAIFERSGSQFYELSGWILIVEPSAQIYLT